ncbi:MAG TPA: sugar phosphate isomerase/epimerase family protein [Desulfosporosinus sp.]|nr:sugar phosphate isomerase/epimerase family protein [Desulfosporosinus sp.]
MKYSIAIGKTISPTSPLILGGDFVQNIKYAANLGYHAVEIHLANPDDLIEDTLKEACNRLKMEISTIGTGFMYGMEGLSLIDDSPEVQMIIMDRMHRFVDKASALRSRITIGSIKGNIPKNKERQPYFDLLAKNLHTISEYAVGKGVLILLEATNRLENNLLNSGKDVHDFITKYQLKNTKILMDSFHINIEEKSVENCLKDTGDLLGYIHFADNTRHYPGAGCFDFKKFKQAILNYGYDGVLSVECLPLPDSETVATKSIQFFQETFG